LRRIVTEQPPGYGAHSSPAALAHPGAQEATPARAAALVAAAGFAGRQRDPEAQRRYAEAALAIYQSVGHKEGLAQALRILSSIAVVDGDLNRAEVLCMESLTLFRELDNRAWEAITLITLGHIILATGDRDRAFELFIECRRICQEVGHQRQLLWVLNTLGRMACDRGDVDEGHRLFVESLTLCQTLAERFFATQVLTNVSSTLAIRGQAARAAKVYAATDMLRAGMGIDRERDPWVASIREALGEEAFSEAWAEGERMTPEQAIDCVLRAD